MLEGIVSYTLQRGGGRITDISFNARKKGLNISSSFDSNVINALLLDPVFLSYCCFENFYFPVFLVKEASNYFSPSPKRKKYFCQNFKGLSE